MSQAYRIQSENTKYYIIGHKETPEGARVMTLNGTASVPSPEYSVRIQFSHFLGIIPGTLIPF